MLKSALPTLKSQIKQILHDAAYKATMSQFVSGSGAPSTYAQGVMESNAEKFAITFSDTAYDDLATAIYDFVLQLGIVATPSGSLMSTSINSPSPVTGSIPMSDFALY